MKLYGSFKFRAAYLADTLEDLTAQQATEESGLELCRSGRSGKISEDQIQGQPHTELKSKHRQPKDNTCPKAAPRSCWSQDSMLNARVLEQPNQMGQTQGRTGNSKSLSKEQPMVQKEWTRPVRGTSSRGRPQTAYELRSHLLAASRFPLQEPKTSQSVDKSVELLASQMDKMTVGDGRGRGKRGQRSGGGVGGRDQ
eukprot:GILJ01031667.1.p1 GENE.GILJ01031667.1~~GILJ01031667.1.p1  ORF type:complete len:197 (-),score=13.97 GILJ01031667.1:75-665(-)